MAVVRLVKCDFGSKNAIFELIVMRSLYDVTSGLNVSSSTQERRISGTKGLPVAEWGLQSGRDVLRVRRHFRSKARIFKPEATVFQVDLRESEFLENLNLIR